MRKKEPAFSVSKGKEPGILLAFMDHLYEEGMHRETAYNYYMTARSLAKFLKKWREGIPCAPEEVVMKEVTADELMSISHEEWDRYIDYYNNSIGETKGSLAVRISVLRKLYRWLSCETGKVVPPYIDRARRPTANPKPHKVISERNVDDIISGLNGGLQERNECIISLVIDCGMGLNEVAALQLEDLEIDRIRVRTDKGKTRYIPLSSRSKAAIDAYLPVRLPPIDGGNALFTSSKRGQLRRGAIQKMLRKAINNSGLVEKSISFRDLQQTSQEKRAKSAGLAGMTECCRLNSVWYIKDKYDLVEQRYNKPPKMERNRISGIRE